MLFITDPRATVDVTSPIRSHISNSCHQIVAEMADIKPADFENFDVVFIAGDLGFIESFKHSFKTPHIPCYTFVHTHLQCMMKQVCAQCIYTVTDPETGFVSVQFGCAKSIENIQKLSYPTVNKRNKNERLEEIILGAVAPN